MKVTVLAGMLLLAAPAYAADSLPDVMLGNWTMGDEEGIMDRADKDSADFLVEKDKYYAVDDACTILHVEKLAENSYLVQARCAYDGADPSIPSEIYVSEFELKGNRLRVTPATGS
jgi:hypothetical protein